MRFIRSLFEKKSDVIFDQTRFKVCAMLKLFTLADKITNRKQEEYKNTVDVLVNFRTMARRQRISTIEAIGNCMEKHIVSIESMIPAEKYKKHDIKVWEEKIVDTIVYLCFIYTAILEKQENKKEKKS